MKDKLQSIIDQNRKWTNCGQVASYIPELAKADPNILGIAINDINDKAVQAGDYNYYFTIQSIVKVIILICLLIDGGEDKIFDKVGMEPSSEPFNSIPKLERTESGKPLNPFINAGAIACTDAVLGKNCKEKYERIVAMLKKLSNNQNLKINDAVYKSEKLTGQTNRAIAHYLKGAGLIDNSVEDVLDVYFKLCSVEMVVKDIAKIASVIANGGIAPWSQEKIIPTNANKIIKAIMTTCGLYDSSGCFAVRVGMPSKSGVGGGIVSVAPNKMGIAVVGPSLDHHGNSIAGVKVLEELSKSERLSIFL
ncbi:glutaminase A [Natranaerobius trueperi]|uniref:Glutaminase n=1 Tax=Natranaerobius trueperi TaxID=759412 RepID=A0A226C3P5_9FIRM|nr:glutaminase A [Natranaerobius trueperi]OWZ85040.1 glutaminase A [Natranaerobius trueperi]